MHVHVYVCVVYVVDFLPFDFRLIAGARRP